MEQGLEASGLDGAKARVEQAMRLIEQAGECLRSADAIALDIDPHYLAAAFTGKTVSLCDQLEQVTKQTAAEIEEMRLQEISRLVQCVDQEERAVEEIVGRLKCRAHASGQALHARRLHTRKVRRPRQFRGIAMGSPQAVP